VWCVFVVDRQAKPLCRVLCGTARHTLLRECATSWWRLQGWSKRALVPADLFTNLTAVAILTASSAKVAVVQHISSMHAAYLCFSDWAVCRTYQGPTLLQVILVFVSFSLSLSLASHQHPQHRSQIRHAASMRPGLTCVLSILPMNCTAGSCVVLMQAVAAALLLLAMSAYRSEVSFVAAMRLQAAVWHSLLGLLFCF
jgi:hypothetical protein